MQVHLNPHCKHTAALDEGTLKIVATSGGACHRAVVTLLRERSVREWGSQRSATSRATSSRRLAPAAKKRGERTF